MSTKVHQLQLLQQNIQNINIQQQQLRNLLLELDSAVQELINTKKAYKIIGGLMIESDPEKLIKELNEKKSVSQLRLKNFDESEEKLKKNMELLQKEVIKELKAK